MNDDAGFLTISGIKHFRFCKRRWALIHIEQQWSENALTLEGHYMHERVHDSSFTQSRGAVLLCRGMPVRSEQLRITGNCDMVELYRAEDGILLQGREGRWRVYPVEYKHGQSDRRGADVLQLCAQAMCLEEMLVTDIPEGAIYYGKTRRRERFLLTQSLRDQVRDCVAKMHALFERGHTPKVKPGKACKSCSMLEACQPALLDERRSARTYIQKALEEETKP